MSHLHLPFGHSASHRTRAPITRGIELFHDLDETTLERIGSCLTVLEVPAGRVLGRRGERCQSFTLILEGQVGASIDGTPVAVLDTGSFFGALPLLPGAVDNHRRTDLTALVPTTIAVANPAEFAGILRISPTVEWRLRLMAKARGRYLDRIAGDGDAQPVPPPAGYPIHISEAGV